MDDFFTGLVDVVFLAGSGVLERVDVVFLAGSGVLERFLPEDFFVEDFFFLVGVLERFGVVDALRREERRTGIVT
tara:strand:- start:8 stop:232 length:225 start_codon:yes stop_codon:yes gene_type:complete